MGTELSHPHLTVDADGSASIERTRYKMIHLAGEHYHYGWSAEENPRQHPDLRPGQVHAALTYFAIILIKLLGRSAPLARQRPRGATRSYFLVKGF